MLLTLWSERTLLGREAGVTMLVVLMALKTLELRARRDAMVVFFLGFFLVLTQLPVLAVAGGGAVDAGVGVGAADGAGAGPHAGRAPATAARRCAGRASAALLRRAGDGGAVRAVPAHGAAVGHAAGRAGRTGLSGTLRMGGVAEIANDDSIAMRVRFFGRVPQQRPAVLSAARCCRLRRPRMDPPDTQFPAERSGRAANCRCFGAPVEYELTLEPSRLSLLPLLEMTPDRPTRRPRSKAGR
jgi:hypothetical protein